MSRSEAFNAGAGNRIHPNVRDYPAERSGGVEGSVVGMVPTHVLAGLREYDRTGPEVDALRADLRSGHGFEEPVVIEYDHRAGHAVLGEGNHRVAAALAEGVHEVPARVQRRTVEPERARMAAHHLPDAEYSPGYVSSALHPSMLQFRESHESTNVMDEIHNLLEPSWRR